MSPGPKKMYSVHLSFRVDPDVRKLLEEMAAEEERTTSQMARILLRRAVMEWRERKRESEATRKEKTESTGKKGR